MVNKQIDSTTGIYSENGLILTVVDSDRGRGTKKLRSMLKIENKSIKWQHQRILKQLAKLQNRINTLQGHWRAQADNRVEFFKQQLKDLEPQLTVEYFEPVDENTTIIPPGYWYLCENIKDNKHLNTEVPPLLLDGLRPYQQEAVTEMLKYRRATGRFATGLGKSIILASICASMAAKKIRTVVLVPTEYLVGQTYDTIKRYGLSVTAAGGGRIPVPGADILVTTVQSAGSHMDLYGCVIADEAHHAPAATWEDVMAKGINVQYSYHLTATPFRADGLDLAIHAFGGPVVVSRDVRWAITNNWLVDPAVYMVDIAPKNAVGQAIVLPDEMISAKAYEKLVQNLMVFSALAELVKKAVASERRIMLLFKTVKAGRAFSKYLAEQHQMKFPVASSASKGVIVKFRNKEIPLLIANDRLVGEGVDIPDADTLILATQHSAKGMTYQAVGRILRKAPDKKKAMVIDVAVSGFSQFVRARQNRILVYKDITGIEPKELGA
jgi:superfamily II DNA or RNA helicase